jgi:hypothetical protein
MITKSQLLDAFNFSSAIENERCNNIKDVFLFLNVFKKVYDQETLKLPYHINLIDELHANENAHSRILEKLLKQQSDGKYEILESFVEYLKNKKTQNGKTSFADITVKHPCITQETQRIDLWIRNTTYAIIIENKIHSAKDQDTQIERYIDITKDNITEEKIFVVYLPPTDKEPTEQSWGKYFNSAIREQRYLRLSFRDDILIWLKEDVLPNINTKDVYLRSAIEQYIDHLEGKFSLRTINNKMNMELQKVIKEQLGIKDNNPDEALEILENKKKELENAIVQIDSLKEKIKMNCFPIWEGRLKNDFPEYTITGNWREPQGDEPKVGLKLSFKKRKVSALIVCDGNEFYYEIMDDETIDPKIKDKLTQLFKEEMNVGEDSKCYMYLYVTSIKEIYPQFKAFVEEFIEKTQ